MDSTTLYYIYNLGLAGVLLLRWTLRSWAEEAYYKIYREHLNLWEWFFLGGALFHCITAWPW